MRPADLLNMLLLGAIWGGAFPLLRVATPAFGPVALIGLRVALAAALLLPLLQGRRALLDRAGAYLVLGLINTAIPFTLFSFATLSINAGLASLLYATTPMFGALIPFAWLGERLVTVNSTVSRPKFTSTSRWSPITRAPGWSPAARAGRRASTAATSCARRCSPTSPTT